MIKVDVAQARVECLRREMFLALEVVEDAYDMVGKSCTITCANDRHPQEDPHTHGFAFDFRTFHLTADEKEKVVAFIKAKLNLAFYFVQLESDHIHVQVRKHLWPSLKKE